MRGGTGRDGTGRDGTGWDNRRDGTGQQAGRDGMGRACYGGLGISGPSQMDVCNLCRFLSNPLRTLIWILKFYPLQLSLPQGTVNKLQYTLNRAAKIVNPKAKMTSWDSIEKVRNTRIAIDVFKSLHNLLPEDLNGYFKRCEHEINRRGHGSCVVLPKMRTATGKKIVCLPGSPHFQPTRKTTRDEISIVLFKEKLKLSKSVDAQEKTFLTLINSYSLIVHYSFYSDFTLISTTSIVNR